jgi:hypothetical protein
MNYLEWNNLIAQHFFNPENAGKDVYLYGLYQKINMKYFHIVIFPILIRHPGKWKGNLNHLICL